MLQIAFAFTLAFILTAPTAMAEYIVVEFPDPCNDDDPDTGCCPLRSLIPVVSANVKDWAACVALDDIVGPLPGDAD